MVADAPPRPGHTHRRPRTAGPQDIKTQEYRFDPSERLFLRGGHEDLRCPPRFQTMQVKKRGGLSSLHAHQPGPSSWNHQCHRRWALSLFVDRGLPPNVRWGGELPRWRNLQHVKRNNPFRLCEQNPRQPVVRPDDLSVPGVLQTLCFDVLPKAFGDLGPFQRSGVLEQLLQTGAWLLRTIMYTQKWGAGTGWTRADCSWYWGRWWVGGSPCTSLLCSPFFDGALDGLRPRL